MRTPRFIRPHSIILKNYIGETEGDPSYKDTLIPNVKVQGPMQNSHSGASFDENLKVSDTIKVIVDMSDCPDGYKNEAKFDIERTGWTIHSSNDIIYFDSRKYSVIGYEEINPFHSNPEFLEILCLRS